MSAAMSIEESMNDHRLLDLIAILSRRGSSGRLQIDCGSTQGSLSFDKGKIAAARIGSLTGFSALNLAISLKGTHLRFDPLVEVPASEFTHPNERHLLNKLFGIETVVPGSAHDLNDSTGCNQSGTYITRQKMTVRAASILLIAGLAAVGITAFRSRANPPAPPNMSDDTTATATSGRNGVPTATPGEGMRIPLTVNANSIPPGPERSMPETTLKKQAIVSSPAPAEARPRGKTKAPSRQPVEGESLDEAKRPAKLVFKEIPVMVRIEDGHVAEAYIKDRHAGAEGYEATALRVARQRRYPKDTMGVETIIVQVANEH